MSTGCFSVCVLFTFLHKLSIVFSIHIFYSLVRFIPRYFMILGAIVNGISFFICLSDASLLEYKNATDFCTLILYPATLLNSCISTSRLLVESVRFSMYNIMSSAKSESLTSSLLILMPLISFCCLIADARTSNTMLNNSGDSGHPCHGPDIRGESSQFFPIEDDISCGLFINGFYDL